MNTLWLYVIGIIGESWFLQGIVINTSFALVSAPFTNKVFKKILINRKKNRIKDASDELNIYCLQHLIKDKHIDNDEFENQLYIIANKYKLDVKDIYNDKNKFWQNLMRIIIKSNLIDDITKEKIANKVRKNKIFIESDPEKSIDKNYNSTILTEDEDHTEEHNDNDDNIQLSKNEKSDIHKYTGITTGIIFIILGLYTLLCQVLIKAYGISAIIFINTIIIIIATIPIFVNGIIHFTKFNKNNKIYFSFLLVISILNVINFVCIIGVLLYKYNVFFQ